MEGNKELYYEYQKNYHKKIREIKQRVANGQKIRVGFLVCALPSFAALPMYRAMQKEELFETKIVMIPSVYNIRNASDIHLEAENVFGKEQVMTSYVDENSFRSFDGNFDIIFFSNPYDKIVLPIHSIEHFAKLGVLTVYIGYGYLTSNHKLDFFRKGHEMSCLWKYYLDSNAGYAEYAAHSPLKGRNAKFLGYAKMDSFIPLPVAPKGKKRIIITAHHSMQISAESIGIQYSCFLRYYDFYLRLAKMYPGVEFVFRPHPLWETVLHEFWPQGMIDEYYRKIEELPNMFLHTDSNYFDLFQASHAMINDCGSYNAEYMFTGKPLCMLSKGDMKDKENYNEYFALQCIKHHYKAYSELDIIAFIEEIVLKENDFMKNDRMAFWDREIKGNWPHSSQYILEDLKASVLG